MPRSRLKFFNEERTPTEPEVQGLILTESEYGDVLNWYSNWVKDRKHAEKYLQKFFEDNDSIYPGFNDILGKLPTPWVNRTAGWIARILSRGGAIPDYGIEFFSRKLDEMASHVHSEVVEIDPETGQEIVPVKEIVSPQVAIAHRVAKIIAELEGWIDEGKVDPLWDHVKYCVDKKIPPMIAKKVSAHFQPILDELFDAINALSEGEPLEGYEKYSEDELLFKAATYQRIVVGGEEVKKLPVERAPVDPAKLFEFFKYAKEAKSLKITSIRPKEIIGAQELWVYTQKYKTLTVFRALDRSGLSVHRTAIDKYDPDESFTIRIGRNTEPVLQAILTLSREDIKEVLTKDGSTPFSPRIHETALLLRVFRH